MINDVALRGSSARGKGKIVFSEESVSGETPQIIIRAPAFMAFSYLAFSTLSVAIFKPSIITNDFAVGRAVLLKRTPISVSLRASCDESVPIKIRLSFSITGNFLDDANLGYILNSFTGVLLAA